MKKIILATIFTFSILVIASAQLSISRDTMVLSGSADEELFGEVVLLNGADTTLDLRWVRTINILPQDWDNYFCAVPGECGLPWTDSLYFELPPATMTTGLLQCHCEPNGNAGQASINVDFVNNDTEEVLGSIVWICDATPVSTNELEKANIKLFPNPASDYFELVNADKVDQIIIYNILGKQVKYFGKEDESYLIGDLVKGLYLVQLIDLDTEATKTLKLKKN
jgi:type IX secretion system substrate protein